MEDGKKAILCVGATPGLQRVMVFPKLEINQVNRTAKSFDSIAGKSINVAKVLKTLGQEVVVTGFQGSTRGKVLVREMSRWGVRCAFTRVRPETRLCVTVIDQGAGTHTELVEESQRINPARYPALADTVRNLLREASLLVLSGTLTPDAPVDFYAKCVRMAEAAGIRSIVDTQGKVLRRTFSAKPYLVKPNRMELASALGMHAETEPQIVNGMKRLMDQGVGAVMISMGAEGALAADAAGFWRLRVPRIEAVNPIGSGDAVTAGIATGLVRGMEFQECCRLGMACGVANALTILAGEVRTEDVERILPQVIIEPLSRS